jgi:hypothetical protein
MTDFKGERRAGVEAVVRIPPLTSRACQCTKRGELRNRRLTPEELVRYRIGIVLMLAELVVFGVLAAVVRGHPVAVGLFVLTVVMIAYLSVKTPTVHRRQILGLRAKPDQ